MPKFTTREMLIQNIVVLSKRLKIDSQAKPEIGYLELKQFNENEQKELRHDSFSSSDIISP